MKKLFIVLVIVCYAFYSYAETAVRNIAVKPDSAETAKQVNKLNAKLLDLKTQLTNVQNQIPVDSAKYQELLSKSQDALQKSKDTAKDAVSGDASDAKKAEKQAKKASDATDDANDAKKQLEKDRKKVKSLIKDILKAQEKLDKLQAPPEQK